MCTVTLLRRPYGYRVVCNRDESRSRRAALPPVQSFAGDRRCVWPVDPAGRGTWIGVNDVGLTVALLNLNPPAALPAPTDAVSRGTIAPRLLSAASLSGLHECLRTMRLECFAPFQLLATDGRRSLVARWDQVALRHQIGPLVDRILMLTSSGLGDHVVTARRTALLRQCIASGQPLEQTQDEFHQHVWPGEEHLSVLMSRRDARTVSRTTIDVSRSGVRLEYAPIDEHAGRLATTGATTLQLPRNDRNRDANPIHRTAIGTLTCA